MIEDKKQVDKLKRRLRHVEAVERNLRRRGDELESALRSLYTVTERREHVGKMVATVEIEEALEAAKTVLEKTRVPG